MFTHTTPGTTPSSVAASPSQPTRDQVVMIAAAALAFIASFLPWVSVSLGFISGSGNAWQSGLLAWASILACMAVGVGTLLRDRLPTLGRFAARHLLVGGAVLAFAFMVVRAIWLPSIPGVRISLGAGFFVALIASLAQVICAVRSYNAQRADCSPAAGAPWQ